MASIKKREKIGEIRIYNARYKDDKILFSEL